MTPQDKTAFEVACLKSALAMGDRLKTMSWFGKNHPLDEAESEYWKGFDEDDLWPIEKE